MNTSKTIWITLALALAIGFGYFVAEKTGTESTVPVIHSYSVPAGRAEEIKNALNKITEASAQVFGNSTLIVKGTPTYQAGIARLLGQIEAQKSIPHTIHFDYWLVRGEDAAQSNAEKVRPLTSVLETINQAQGPKKFTLLEHIGFNSLDHREVVVQSVWAEVKDVSKVLDDSIEILTDIKAHSLGELKINTQVKPGEFVILGENGIQSEGTKLSGVAAIPDGDHRSSEVYHIIRAEIVK
jgi:hypothetical protein